MENGMRQVQGDQRFRRAIDLLHRELEFLDVPQLVFGEWRGARASIPRARDAGEGRGAREMVEIIEVIERRRRHGEARDVEEQLRGDHVTEDADQVRARTATVQEAVGIRGLQERAGDEERQRRIGRALYKALGLAKSGQQAHRIGGHARDADR